MANSEILNTALAAAAALAGKLPGQLGFALKLAFTLARFFVGDDVDKKLEELKAWVRFYVNEKVTDKQVEDLHDQLKGIKLLLDRTEGLEGQGKFDVLVSAENILLSQSEQYFGEDDHEAYKQIASAMCMATMHSCILTELATMQQNGAAQSPVNYRDVRTKNMQRYQTALYTEYAKACKGRGDYWWVGISGNRSSNAGGSTFTWHATAHDDMRAYKSDRGRYPYIDHERSQFRDKLAQIYHGYRYDGIDHNKDHCVKACELELRRLIVRPIESWGTAPLVIYTEDWPQWRAYAQEKMNKVPGYH